MLFEVGVSFEVDAAKKPASRIFHDALESLKGFCIEASSGELAELYAELMRVVLTTEGNREEEDYVP
jgi:hypothetical protein